jgi:hypothetical protein
MDSNVLEKTFDEYFVLELNAESTLLQIFEFA